MENRTTYRLTGYYAFAAFAGILCIFLAGYLGFLEGINNYAYDLCFRIRGGAGHGDRIVIAAIDEKTLDTLGRWPIPRSHYARLLEKVGESQAVIFDIIMAEPSADDTLLAPAIKRRGRVLFPLYIENQAKEVINPAFLSPFGTGHVHVEEEIDGVVRKIFHTLYFRGLTLPSISSAGYGMITGRPFPRNRASVYLPNKEPSGVIFQRDPLKINYYGGPETFRHLSLTDILDDRHAPAFFRDKIVMVGVTAAGIEAKLLTPFSGQRSRMSGVEVHANVLNNLLVGDHVRDMEEWFQFLVCILVAIPLFLLCIRMAEKKATLLWVLCLVLITVAVYTIFVLLHAWFNPALFWLSATFVFVTAYIFRLDEAARNLDQGYASIVSIPGWKTEGGSSTEGGNGLFNLFSAGGINAKIQLLGHITDQLRYTYLQISEDLKAAAEMQKELLPDPAFSIPGIHAEWLFFPSRYVAGDIFNYFQIDGEHVGFYLADVSGHGVPAAMLAVTISKILAAPKKRSHLFHFVPDLPGYEISSPARAMADINHFFSTASRSDQYFTMIYGIVDIAGRTITIAQAGLPPPIMVRKSGEAIVIGKGGFPVGLMDGMDYEDEVISYAPGDRLFLYSDGITECFNTTMEQYGTDRLAGILREGRNLNLKELLPDIEKALILWRGNTEFDDDLTMFAMEFEDFNKSGRGVL